MSAIFNTSVRLPPHTPFALFPLGPRWLTVYLVEADDVRVLQQLHDLHLSENLFQVLVVQLRLIHYFYRHLGDKRDERERKKRRTRMERRGWMIRERARERETTKWFTLNLAVCFPALWSVTIQCNTFILMVFNWHLNCRRNSRARCPRNIAIMMTP